MTKRRPVSKKWHPRKVGPYQLRVEPLEARRLLAGLQVSVFVDQDGSRSYDQASDTSAAGRLVFIDLDQSNSYDAGEPLQVTDASGVAVFEDLELSDYSIGVLTNPNSQRQTTSVKVAPIALERADFGAAVLLADADLSHVWAVDSYGGLTSVSDSEATPGDLGGPVTGPVLQEDHKAWLVGENYEDASQTLVEFDLQTGVSRQYSTSGLGVGESIRQLAKTPQTIYALLDVPRNTSSSTGTALVQLEAGGDGYEFASRVELDATLVVGSPTDALLAAATDTEDGDSQVRLLNQDGSELSQSMVSLNGPVDSLVFSSDGQLLLAGMQGGGVNAFAVQDGQLVLQAILNDARGPISARASDGRIVTGSLLDDQEVIVWDTQTWLPAGKSSPVGSLPEEISTIVTDSYGETALFASDSGIFVVDLAVKAMPSVTLDSQDAVAELQVGVRVSGDNAAPDVSGYEVRSVDEDMPDELTFGSDSGVVDADGDALWFTLATPPSHGQLQVNENGAWSYQPSENYSGEDSAVIRVHDGLASSDLVVRWMISPVNDPPLDLNVQLTTLAENSDADTQIGFVSVVDADQGAQYRITSSDPRFSIVGGQVFFQDGELDFDSEPTIAFEVLATDLENPEYSISTQATLTLQNVNEPPTEIALESNTALENVPGVVIGQIHVEDPDADSQYEYQVSDDRFEVRDGVLRLIEGETFDYETEDVIELTVTAREVGDDGHEIEEFVTLTVVDSNDPPTDIVLGGDEVSRETEGAIIGTIEVEDPDGDGYDFEVSDDRIHVVDGVLRVKEDELLDEETGESLEVTVTATSPNGDKTSKVFPINVVPRRSPHQNPLKPGDVNGDGVVSPLDALILINEINADRGGPLPANGGGGTGESSKTKPDVNGDGVLSPMDVLIIINELNGSYYEAEGESVATSDSAETGVPWSEDERRKQQNSQIDADLELLLDELSSHRLKRG